MNIQGLIKLLREGNSSEVLHEITKLENTDERIHCIHEILESWSKGKNNIPEDIAILLEQLLSLKVYQEKYEDILLKDFLTIIKELLFPTEDLSVIFLEEAEWREVKTLYCDAMKGDSNAQTQLAHFYKDIDRHEWAFRWFKAAADLGNMDASYWLGNYYYDGKVVEKDDAKTYAYYQKAAKAGHPDAMNNYADMYLRGEYVEKDEKRAFELFSKAAELGVPEAMYTLGYMCDNGVGTEKNLDKSNEWYRESAIHGDNFAANKLGHRAFEKGDDKEALAWYRLAADRGDRYGEFNLGLCYETGIGTEINERIAKQWYQKAAIKGDEQAKNRLKRFK
ncbi:sel1 repeat family protein [Oceanobacillus piezotolerans]|uniref:Sel1 repeat family protein n=1 Tax=Oceanobacillus piezotolerans TaxID=2448030 RepID=A0A498DFJ8_9BACI|nr:tetratricopeptide repeat protein [Oceanobacillus piezotolerans]RLL46711.1 sel1 repeat family protein [Oceanobacillus piezotolerans]